MPLVSVSSRSGRICKFLPQLHVCAFRLVTMNNPFYYSVTRRSRVQILSTRARNNDTWDRCKDLVERGWHFCMPGHRLIIRPMSKPGGALPLGIHTAEFVHVLVLLAAGFALCFGESINLTWPVARTSMHTSACLSRACLWLGSCIGESINLTWPN